MAELSEFYACKNISQPFLNPDITVHSDGMNKLERGLVFADEVIDNAVSLCIKKGVVCKNFAFFACSLAFKESLDRRIIIQSAEQEDALRRGGDVPEHHYWRKRRASGGLKFRFERFEQLRALLADAVNVIKAVKLRCLRRRKLKLFKNEIKDILGQLFFTVENGVNSHSVHADKR